ncbi:MAG TPA: hypothetical protein VGM23_17475, partial [Armatimonadota bacterium]
FGVGNWLYKTLAHSPLDDRGTMLVLWLFECAIIGYIVWRNSERSWTAFAGGMLLGLLSHVLIVGMIVLFSSMGSRNAQIRLSWLVIQLPAMIGAIWVVTVPVRNLLQAMSARQEAKEKQQKKGATHFAFKQAEVRKAPLDYVTGMPRVVPIGEQRAMPPESFKECAPARDITGTVVVLREVIIDSVPEAAPHLPKDQTIRIPLAYIIPQIGRPTYWLTWRQAMSPTVPPPGQPYPAVAGSPELNDRWVRLCCRHVLQQIPPEYFTKKKRLPAWALLPEVPQEAQLAAPPRKEG